MRDTLSTVRPTWKGRLLRALSRLFPRRGALGLPPEFGPTVADLLALFPDGYHFEVLPDLRDVERAEWSDDLSLLESDRHPYLCAAPGAASATGHLSLEPATH